MTLSPQAPKQEIKIEEMLPPLLGFRGSEKRGLSQGRLTIGLGPRNLEQDQILSHKVLCLNHQHQRTGACLGAQRVGVQFTPHLD